MIGALDPESLAVAERVATDRHARLIRPQAAAAELSLRAAGGFQRANFALAAAAAEAFLGRPLEPAAVEAAASGDARPRSPGGRLRAPADGARRRPQPSGARALAESLDAVLGERRPRVAVIGVLDDKDAAGMLEALLPRVDRIIFTRSQNPRSLSPATLTTLEEKLGGPPSETVADPLAALARARELAGPDGSVLATGSIYLIADLVREHADARASTL